MAQQYEYALFQFHNGTIKTIKHTMHQEVAQMFQFHNGTIKTRYGK